MLEKLKLKMTGNCSQAYGYILEVKKIISLGENKISSSNSLPVFNVTYEAIVLKPVNGDIISGIVYMILQNGEGIMVNVYDIIQVLIPSLNMKPYIFNSVSWDIPTEKITIGGKINIKIIANKYEKKQYSCIGKINKV